MSMAAGCSPTRPFDRRSHGEVELLGDAEEILDFPALDDLAVGNLVDVDTLHREPAMRRLLAEEGRVVLPAVRPTGGDAVPFRDLLVDDDLVGRHVVVVALDIAAHVVPRVFAETGRVAAEIRRDDLIERVQVAPLKDLLVIPPGDILRARFTHSFTSYLMAYTLPDCLLRRVFREHLRERPRVGK